MLRIDGTFTPPIPTVAFVVEALTKELTVNPSGTDTLEFLCLNNSTDRKVIVEYFPCSNSGLEQYNKITPKANLACARTRSTATNDQVTMYFGSCTAGPTAWSTDTPGLTINKQEVTVGTPLRITGTNFAPGAQLTVTIGTFSQNVTVGSNRQFTIEPTIPDTVSPGLYGINIVDH